MQAWIATVKEAINLLSRDSVASDTHAARRSHFPHQEAQICKKEANENLSLIFCLIFVFDLHFWADLPLDGKSVPRCAVITVIRHCTRVYSTVPIRGKTSEMGGEKYAESIGDRHHLILQAKPA